MAASVGEIRNRSFKGLSMSGFSKEWLALREREDLRARDASLVGNLEFSPVALLRVIDLGAGSGSNLRYLAPRLARAQHWTLVDWDIALLSAISVPQTSEPLTTEARSMDLAGDLDSLELEACDLLTGSAFFDLVSAAWVARLAKKCARAKVTNGLFVLNVDGRIAWSPEEEEDGEVTSLFNAHMQRDKGFGPALGPDAAEALSECFAREGYNVEIGESPWRIASGATALQRQLLEGYVRAASEQDPSRSPAIQNWAKRRSRHLEDGGSSLFVGHHDVLVRLT
ncbi:MAG: hypothetical protein RJB62_1527 [Pseudomonadota bacterium]|jgi:SAM-dependent methyltransferase